MVPGELVLLLIMVVWANGWRAHREVTKRVEYWRSHNKTISLRYK